MHPTPRPTSSAERIDALDAMRGMAILGVLVAYTVWSLGNPPEETWSAVDRAVARGMDLLVDNKFLSMFAFLFGLGITQQWRRWDEAGVDPLPLHLRRMGFLFGVGLLHAIFIRNGDILVPYALMGLLLLPFRKASARAILIALPVLFVIPTVADLLLHRSWPQRPGAIEGGYIVENVTWLRFWYVTNPLLGWPRIFILVLLGLLAGRARLVERLAGSRPLARRALLVALPVAVATRLAYEGLLRAWASPPPRPLLQSVTIQGFYEIGSWALAATYIAGLLLVMQWGSWSRHLWPLRAVGRMAFTNYLSQGLILVPLCLVFGWFDHVSPGRGVLLAAVFALAQLLWSTGWLKRHATGPFERVWRRVTYLA